jgi:hypothetical protein
MNVNAVLDGNAVVIVSMTVERYRAFVTYIDTISGSGNLLTTEIPIVDFSTDVPIAVSASHN